MMKAYFIASLIIFSRRRCKLNTVVMVLSDKSAMDFSKRTKPQKVSHYFPFFQGGLGGDLHGSNVAQDTFQTPS
jgi:hypothetical protein